jgi:hypothetical protein
MNKTIFLLAIALAACNKPGANTTAASQVEQVGLKSYFQKEASRLQKANPVVKKTVVANGKVEKKELKIRSWTRELTAFIDADIDKKAWAGEFKKKVVDSMETYVSDNEKIPVKKVVVYKSKKQISGIVIVVRNENYLYTSTDTLSYYPGKKYEVKKMQQIKLMNKKQYQITGLF